MIVAWMQTNSVLASRSWACRPWAYTQRDGSKLRPCPHSKAQQRDNRKIYDLICPESLFELLSRCFDFCVLNFIGGQMGVANTFSTYDCT